MSHQALMTAIGTLFYNRGVRDRFYGLGGSGARGTTRPDPNALAVPNLTAAERALLASLDGARLAHIVKLHAGELALAWYANRLPATWLALQAALDIPETELVMRLTESPAFSHRVDDDRTGAALAAFVAELTRGVSVRGVGAHAHHANPLRDTPWLPDLLEYERALEGMWEGIPASKSSGTKSTPTELILTFDYDIEAIHASILTDSLVPTDEPRQPTTIRFTRDATGTTSERIK